MLTFRTWSKPGTRLKSSVCATAVIVVRASGGDVDLRCGGHAMVLLDQSPPAGSVDLAHSRGPQLDKRYAAGDGGLEILCTMGGEGSLSLGDEPIPLKEAKPLPSSD
jgi:hypothetical protein